MTKQETEDSLKEIYKKLSLIKEKIDFDVLKKEHDQLLKLTLDSGFWDDPNKASKTTQQIKFIQDTLQQWESIFKELDDTLLILESFDSDEFDEVKSECMLVLKKANRFYVSALLNDKHDNNSAILTVICGTGGKDAQDFTEMLANMYMKYAEQQEYSVEILDKTVGEEAGLKNITLLIQGPKAYGYLKNEHGVHRLVRLSPFNSGNTRETSFAMVDVVPEIDLNETIEIDESDLKIDVFRASGAGGQHVNVTDSAVRITHVPTGIVVVMQNERSQHKNKEQALKVLHGKLTQQLLEQNVTEVNKLRGVKTEMSWGNQIRSYVLHPYKLVKDHRTNFENTDVDAVLQGGIQSFIEEFLLLNA